MPPARLYRFSKPGVMEVLGRRLTADPVMALEDDAGVPVEGHQTIVALLIEQAGTGDCRDRPLLWRADVDELERLAAVHHLLEIGGGELLNGHGRSSHDPPRHMKAGFGRQRQDRISRWTLSMIESSTASVNGAGRP